MEGTCKNYGGVQLKNWGQFFIVLKMGAFLAYFQPTQIIILGPMVLGRICSPAVMHLLEP